MALENSDKVKNVALCVTCLADQMLPEIGVATVKLLRRAGYEVDFPMAQTCCGQPYFNSGFRDQAVDLADEPISRMRLCHAAKFGRGN